jgi:hypothetical protein
MSEKDKKNIKVTYIEYNDQGKLDSKEISVPAETHFYNFDSQFTILEKLGNVIRRQLKYLCVQINGNHMLQINNEPIHSIKHINDKNLKLIKYKFYEDIFLGQLWDPKNVNSIDIINFNVLQDSPKLITAIESDYGKYLSEFLVYYFPMLYTHNIKNDLYESNF